jgi:dTDP-glucose 4,6-dehydratase
MGLSRKDGYDLNYDVEKIIQALRFYGATHVVNFASLSMVAQSWERPKDWMQTNIVGTVNLFDRLHKVSTLEKYLHFSTPEVFGSEIYARLEHEPYNPSTPYAASRASAEIALKMYGKQGLPYIITRCSNVYGEGQQPYRLIPKAARCALSGEVFTVDGDGSTYRAYIHAEDMTQALMLILRKGAAGKSYHISGSQFASISEVLKLVETHAGPMKIVNGPLRKGSDHSYILCDHQLQRLGFEQRITLDVGIGRVVDWVEQHPQEPKEYAHVIQTRDQDQVCVG